MKKNKLLAPLLGLSTVATVVVPVATSCASNTVETTHVKATPVSEKKAINGVAEFLLELDSSDYDKNNFTVSVAVSADDESGAKSSDFSVINHSIDKNQLVVDVMFNPETPLEVAQSVILDIKVKYGSLWTNTVEVKMICPSSITSDMVYTDILGVDAYVSVKKFDVVMGETYTLTLNYDTEIDEGLYRITIGTLSANGGIVNVGFEDIEVTCNGTQLTKDTDFTLETESGVTGFARLNFDNKYEPKKGDKFVFKFVKATSNRKQASAYGYQG